MLDRDRVIIMTRMAAQRQRLERTSAGANEYFRGDYVGLYMLKAAIVASILYAMILTVYIAFNFNELLDTFYEGGITPLATRVVFYYFLLLAVNVGISYAVYSVRYTRVRKKARSYYNRLRKLEDYYRSAKP